MQNWKTSKLKRLAQALLCLKKESDLLNFLRDIATLEELEELAERWEIAQLLDKGESYRTIAQKTGMSTTTITRISLWLRHGEGGYQTALAKLRKKP